MATRQTTTRRTETKEETIRVSKAPVFRGTVVSDVQDKTIVVSVEMLKTHPKYRRKYRSTKRYQVDDSENRAKKGDVVEFRECPPISRHKRHRLV